MAKQLKDNMPVLRLREEILSYGIDVTKEDYMQLEGYVVKHGVKKVGTALTSALDRYTDGRPIPADMSPMGYVFQELRKHHWNRNGNTHHNPYL